MIVFGFQYYRQKTVSGTLVEHSVERYLGFRGEITEFSGFSGAGGGGVHPQDINRYANFKLETL